MKRVLNLLIYALLVGSGCKTKEVKFVVPDVKPNFLEQLKNRDSTLVLDSFYFVGADTMNEKRALIHQRFSFLTILNKIIDQESRLKKGIDSQQHSIPPLLRDSLQYFNGELNYVNKQIDSMTALIAKADSITPVGYRAFFKVTISKPGAFTISDTLPYSISLSKVVSDWDRNLAKNLDSLSVGKKFHPNRIGQ